MTQQTEMPTVQVELTNYPADKAEGAARVVKVEGALYYSMRAFHPKTGDPTPILIPLNRDVIETGMKKNQAVVDAMKILLEDMDAAKEIT